MSDFKALVVHEKAGSFVSSLERRPLESLPAGDVLIRVKWSSLNFKDALSATGHKLVTREYPHTPGIDAAGVVVDSAVPYFAPGDEVIVTGYDLGMNTSGGFGQYIRVPAKWLISRPEALSLRDSMVLGTAGLTAALCIDKLEKMGLVTGHGPVLVTGASGGVGSVAVSILAALGHEVFAVTGKLEQTAFLSAIGAAQVLPRSELQAGKDQLLLQERWAGVVDTVGGDILFNAIKSLQYGASVVCCGMTAGAEFASSVYPYILRNVNLLGIDSVNQPLEVKAAMWDRLANQWETSLHMLEQEVRLEDLPQAIETTLAGEMVGRTVINLG